MNHQDRKSVEKALSVFSSNIKQFVPRYEITSAHKEILLDFAESKANAFEESFGSSVSNLLRGCSVHFIRSAMRIAKNTKSFNNIIKISNLHVCCKTNT